ncbi:MAG: c-type cytochrome [Pseudomonadota bacterium]
MKTFPALLAALLLTACGDNAAAPQGAGGPPDAPRTPAEKGRMAFNECGACHTVREGDPSRIGPNLSGVIGRRAGALEDFAYSAAFQNADVVWDETALDAFLARPQEFLRGNRMAYPGEPDAETRADLIAYLKSISPEAD